MIWVLSWLPVPRQEKQVPVFDILPFTQAPQNRCQCLCTCSIFLVYRWVGKGRTLCPPGLSKCLCSLNTSYSNRTGLARTIFKIFRSVFSAHIPVQAAAAYQADRAAFALGSVAFFGLLLHGDALLLRSGIFRLLRTHCQ